MLLPHDLCNFIWPASVEYISEALGMLYVHLRHFLTPQKYSAKSDHGNRS